MDISQDITMLLFAIVPGLLVFLTAYFMIKRFIDNEQRMKFADIKASMKKDLLPLRLQAYERIVLFLERVSPNNLLNRVYETDMSVADFHRALLLTIRTEYEHNITQQVYMTNSVWNVVKNGRDELVKTINLAYGECNADAPGLELSKKIFEVMVRKNEFPIQSALDQVKNEAHQLF
ncbi:MAG: hypothetical protein ACKO0X_07340 [Bacteroidota bacterium]